MSFTLQLRKLTERLQEEYPVSLWTSTKSYDDTNAFIISEIIVNKDRRKEGIGTKVMEEFCKFADDTKSLILLTPDNTWGSSITRLNKFYRRFDFKKNKDSRFFESMMRKP